VNFFDQRDRKQVSSHSFWTQARQVRSLVHLMAATGPSLLHVIQGGTAAVLQATSPRRLRLWGGQEEGQAGAGGDRTGQEVTVFGSTCVGGRSNVTNSSFTPT
jgi:hypothetical protein